MPIVTLKKIAWLAVILIVVLACNSLFVPEATITCGPSIIPTRLWPTPIPYP